MFTVSYLAAGRGACSVFNAGMSGGFSLEVGTGLTLALSDEDSIHEELLCYVPFMELLELAGPKPTLGRTPKVGKRQGI